MARKRKHKAGRRRNPVGVANPPRRARRRHSPVRRRRNPPAFDTRNILNNIVDGGIHGGLIVAGKVAARTVRARFGYLDGTVIASGIECGVGLGLGMFAGRVVGNDKARSLMHGAFAGAIEAVLRSVAPDNPTVREALGASGRFDTAYVFPAADATVERIAGYDESGGTGVAGAVGQWSAGSTAPQLRGLYA